MTSNETHWRNQRKQRRQKLQEKNTDVDNKVGKNFNSLVFIVSKYLTENHRLYE